MALTLIWRHLQGTNRELTYESLLHSGLEIDQIKNFFTRDATLRRKEKQFAALKLPIFQLFDEYGLNEIEVLRTLRDTVEGKRQTPALQPNDFNTQPDSSPPHHGIDDETATVIDQVSGLWYFVRLSHTDWDDPKVPEFNISLVSFPPLNVVMDGGAMYMQFSRGKFDPDYVDRFGGRLVVDTSRLHLIGTRRNSRSWRPSFMSFRTAR
ncbi:MAG: hypothetical protein AAF253_13000 [Pseudomonadota bacterium]